jgi:hypothetical protein
MEAAVNLDLDPNTLIGLGSALLAIVGAIVSGWVAARTNRQAHDLERQRRLETATERAERILAEYRDPLLDAAQTLQARVYNIVRNGYLPRYLTCGDPAEERYARDYTVFALAEYLCWVEIVRRELRFLDLGDVERNRKLLGYLTQAQMTIQSDKVAPPFRVFRGSQRAIAELMMVPTNATGGPRFEAMGYAAFVHRLDVDSEFAAWFTRLRMNDIDTVEADGPGAHVRLAMLQHDMLDLIDFLDPKSVRIPPQLRSRLPERPTIPHQAAPIVA